mmetsp:Transcript_4175/g.6328  ORF Transcript_4175/g.6328 Transcript_4175/m.6328 type:complete len:363 (-) Transcript_4175:243-1331(-)|eukprot:CAMPEP_0195293586 /NCGR_PEP_ID=MMETSP0707-20130614/12819_1 /TAXON_ID=33640 /ORGANISM="Asterionellopsis glacialis, Strain CCMP134" /LENGTH=362 /DNA_ID=CAMNT_0040354333 /DNA_START=128 /DNA_END=1216 /DNA_ORIENTATION=-
MTESHKEDDKNNMTPDQRMAWLKERGVLVETAEDRQAQQQAVTTTPSDDNDGPQEIVTFVKIPHDEAQPLEELQASFAKSSMETKGDLLVEYLKPAFTSKHDGKDVDLRLFQNQAQQHLASSNTTSSGGAPGSVSEEALAEVAKQANVEIFPLVHATSSNKFTAINMYLDEVGMLKRLPLNKRAIAYATHAGFNPPPQFYGDIYLGRVKTSPKVRNMSFKLGEDTSTNAEWMKKATMDNLEHQTTMNQITGRNDLQPSADGEDGIAKTEEGYSWTQTEEEIEVVVPLAKDALAKEIHVKFMPKSLKVNFRKESVLDLQLFERVDPDGCTWTLDKAQKDAADVRNLVITLEKNSETSWPRITT